MIRVARSKYDPPIPFYFITPELIIKATGTFTPPPEEEKKSDEEPPKPEK